MSRSFDNPPPEWMSDVVTIDAAAGVYMRPSDDENPTFWHWCIGAAFGPRWTGMGTSDHDLVQRDPITLSPSLACPACPLHGFIRNGRWESA